MIDERIIGMFRYQYLYFYSSEYCLMKCSREPALWKEIWSNEDNTLLSCIDMFEIELLETKEVLKGGVFYYPCIYFIEGDFIFYIE